MRLLLLPLILLVTFLSATTKKPDAATMQQVRAIRRLTGKFLELMGGTIGLVQNRQFNGQFPACIDFFAWAVKDAGVFASPTGEDLDEKFNALGETLKGSALFTNVFPREMVSEFFEEIAKNKAAYRNNFDASHLVRLEKGFDSWLNALAHSGNRRILRLLVDFAVNSAYSDRAKVTNSLANFMSLVIQSSRLQAPSSERSEWFNFALAMRGLRRFVNHVLPTPTDPQSAGNLFAFLSGLSDALKSDDPSSTLGALGTQLAKVYPVFASVDYKYYATRVRKAFLRTPRLSKQVRFYLNAFLQKYKADQQKGADSLAFGVYYTSKSLVVDRSDGDLVQVFLERLGLVVIPQDVHLAESAGDLLEGIAQRISTFPREKLLTTPIGIIPKRIARFIGLSEQSDFNDSMMTEITGIKNSDVILDTVKNVYYDFDVHKPLREFFGDEDEANPTFDFAAFFLKHYLNVQKLAKSSTEAYLQQRNQIAGFLGDLIGLGRDAVGAVLILISTRPDYVTEARVLLRLSEFGLNVLDSKSFAQAVASVKPALLGLSHEEDEILGDFMNTDELLYCQEMSPDVTSSYCSPDDADSGSDGAQEHGEDDESNSQSASEGTDSDPQGTHQSIASSLLDLHSF